MQLAYEVEGTVRYTVMRPLPCKGTDNFVINTILGYKSQAHFAKHNARKDPLFVKTGEMLGPEFAKNLVSMTVAEHNNAVHFDRKYGKKVGVTSTGYGMYA
jgi:hypothetical protein